MVPTVEVDVVQFAPRLPRLSARLGLDLPRPGLRAAPQRGLRHQHRLLLAAGRRVLPGTGRSPGGDTGPDRAALPRTARQASTGIFCKSEICNVYNVLVKCRLDLELLADFTFEPRVASCQ